MTELPTDLVQRGFSVRLRESWNGVIWRGNRERAVALQPMTLPRYLLISEQFGVAAGISLAEAVEGARALVRLIEYVNKKRAEEAADVH